MCTVTCVIHVPHTQNSYLFKLYFIKFCHRYWKLDEEEPKKNPKPLPSSKLSHKLEKYSNSLKKNINLQKYLKQN